MKKLLSLIVLLTLTMTAFSQINEVLKQDIPEDYGYIVKIGQQMPDIKMELTDGTVVTTADLKGKVVMLQFTASWCSVCRKEMPHIEKDIWLKHKVNKDFVLIGVDMNEPLDKVKKFQKDMKTTYPLALDPDAKIFCTFDFR